MLRDLGHRTSNRHQTFSCTRTLPQTPPPRQPPSLETMPMGKGSTQRPPCVPKSTVDQNYERTFPPKTPEDPWTKKTCSKEKSQWT